MLIEHRGAYTVSGTINNDLLLFITVKLMPLVGSWITANLLLRVLFRASIYSIVSS